MLYTLSEVSHAFGVSSPVSHLLLILISYVTLLHLLLPCSKFGNWDQPLSPNVCDTSDNIFITRCDTINPKEVGPPGVLGFSKKKSGVQIVVHDSFAGAFAKDGAPNEAQRRRAFGGCGQWCLIPDTAEDRTTCVEGIE